MWTCQDGLALSPRTSREFAGSMSPPLPARPATLWPASCHGSTWPGNGRGSCRALLGQALLPGAGYPATAGEGGLRGVRVWADNMWGMDKIGTEAELKLTLMEQRTDLDEEIQS